MSTTKDNTIPTTTTTVKVAIIGSSNSGKTSLIGTFVQGVFPTNPNPPHVLEEIHVAADMSPLDDVGLTLFDTGGNMDDETTLNAISKADVVIITYPCTDEKEFSQLGPKWLDKLTTTNFSGPIVLVGTKNDLLPESERRDPDKRVEELSMKLQPLLNKYRIEACLECSSKNNMHIMDVFYFAQHAVVYPVSPLFEGPDMEIKPKFRLALERVFRYFDMDRDDVLNDDELNDFLKECFKASLPQHDLDGVKALLLKESKSYVTPENKVTKSGFYSLFRIFSLKNRPETSWIVVRTFNYNDQLQFVLPVTTYRHLYTTERNKSIELSSHAITFLTSVFNQFDRDCDGALNPFEFQEAISVTGMTDPFGEHDLPFISTKTQQNNSVMMSSRTLCSLTGFPETCQTNPAGHVTLKGWLAQWSMCASLQPALALQCFAMMGYRQSNNNNLTSALILGRGKEMDMEKKYCCKSIVRVAIVGDHGVGKTSLQRALTRKWSLSNNTSKTTSTSSVVALVKPLDSMETYVSSNKNAQGNNNNNSGGGGGGGQGYLILTEISREQIQSLIKTKEFQFDFDLCIMMFDASRKDSVEFLDEIMSQIPSQLPCIVLCNKADLVVNSTPQGGLNETTTTTSSGNNPALKYASQLCERYSLNPPESIVSIPPTTTGTTAATAPTSKSGNAEALRVWTQKIDHWFQVVFTLALVPPPFVFPMTSALKQEMEKIRVRRMMKRVGMVMGVTTLLIGGGIYYWMGWWNKNNNNNNVKKQQLSLANNSNSNRNRLMLRDE
jgi:Ras family protein T1